MNNVENKKFLDPNLKNKLKTVEDKIQLYNFKGDFLPLPTEIEISESGTCNRSCSFCPRSAKDFKDIKEFISLELHEKLCKELAELNYKGTVRYSGFVEPLLDKNIYKLIRMVKDNIPNTNIELVTNGDVLNDKRLNKLFDNGLISINSEYKVVVSSKLKSTEYERIDGKKIKLPINKIHYPSSKALENHINLVFRK